MGKLRFVLGNFWLWAAMAIGCMLAENLAILTPNPRAGYNNITFWMLTICSFFCLAMYLYFEHKKNHVKFDKFLLPIIVGLTIVMLGTIIMQSGETFIYQNGKESITVTFTMNDRIKYCAKLIFLMAFSYTTTFVMFANRPTTRSWIWLPVLILVLAYISIFYSIFTESTIIASYFRSRSVENIKSFFLNPNAMGICLLLGILACFVINIHKPNIVTFLSIPVLFVFMCFTKCASTLLVSGVIIPFYLVVEIFRNIRKHFLITIFASAFVILFLAGFVIILAYFAGKNNLFVNNVLETVKLFFKGLKLESISGRASSFKAYIGYCSDTPWHFIFGRGYGTSDVYVVAMCKAIRNGHGVLSTENGFIQTFISFGIIGVFAYIGLLGVFGYSIFKLIIYKQPTFAITYLLCVLALVVNDFVETNNFYDLGFKETTMTLAFLMPPIVKAKFITKQKKVNEIKNIHVETKFDIKKACSIFSSILLLVIAAAGAAFLSPYASSNPTIYLIIIGGTFAALLLVPYLIYLWFLSKDPVVRFLHVSLNLIAMFLFAFVAFILTRRAIGGPSQYIIAGIAAVVFIVLDIIIYSFIRRDLFKTYLSITFIEPLKICLFPFVVGFAGTFIFAMIFITQGTMGALETLGFSMFFILASMAGLYLIPNRMTKPYMNYFNDRLLNRWSEMTRQEYR